MSDRGFINDPEDDLMIPGALEMFQDENPPRAFGYSIGGDYVEIFELIGDDPVPYLALELGEIFDTIEALEAQADEIVTALNCSKLPVD